ncbi:MAG: hypothetical protein WC524_09210 [Candidatus Aminicenantales bacterium]|jgi:hypothetical protein|nr:hypothetical protein [Candidatus Saccharicenans sp.]NMC65550.1 hypothetical protein [Acidobacteriota bacterium]
MSTKHLAEESLAGLVCHPSKERFFSYKIKEFCSSMIMSNPGTGMA